MKKLVEEGKRGEEESKKLYVSDVDANGEHAVVLVLHRQCSQVMNCTCKLLLHMLYSALFV